LLSNAAACLCLLATDLGFDGIDGGDACQRLAGNRRIAGLGDLVELPPPVRPAEGKPDGASSGQRAIPSITIDL
jgi:hypothetical protein